jgi:hypothetical protein
LLIVHSLFQADPGSMAELMERLQKVDSGISSESGDSQAQSANHVQLANPNNHVQPANPNHSGHSANPNNPVQAINPTNPVVHPAVTSVLHDYEAEAR